jgi:hypothetical protein
MTRFCSAILAAALMAGLPAAATSQVSFGVKAGLNVATLAGDDVPDEVDSRTGLVAGGLMNLRLSDLLSIQPEALYSQKGAGGSLDLFGERLDFTLKLDYLEVPVLLRLTVPTAAAVQPSLHFGPTFAFELSCKVTVSGFGETDTEDCDNGFDDPDRRKFDPGLAVGGGLDIPVGRGTLLLDARYTVGLRSLDSTDDVRSRVLSLSAGFRFR